MSELKKYKKLTDIEHVRIRPSMYIGTIETVTRLEWVIRDNNTVQEEVTYSPGIVKLFDEVVTNCVDEHIRSRSVTKIEVVINRLTGEISIGDNGGIPVKKHPEHNVYIPELIFSELRAGSNFDDEDRMGGGMNGLGASLVNVYSDLFIVETCDGVNYFRQEYSDGMHKKGKPFIEPGKKKGTTITFLPDYEYFNTSLDDGNIDRITKRVYDIAGCNPGIAVYLDGHRITHNTFEKYVSMYTENAVHDRSPDAQWRVALAPSIGDGFTQISFVNNIDTYNGGTHIDYVLDQIVGEIRAFVKKKHKVDVKPSAIKQQLTLFVQCNVNAPMFSSQTKENLTLDPKKYSTEYIAKPSFIKTILESSIVERVLSWAEDQQRREELAELAKLNKMAAKNNSLKKIVKFEDATSKDRRKCVLFLTEGDSAKSSVMSARDSSIHGVFPLKGKLLNVRNIPIKKLIANEEIQNFLAITGLKVGQSVDTISAGKSVVVEFTKTKERKLAYENYELYTDEGVVFPRDGNSCTKFIRVARDEDLDELKWAYQCKVPDLRFRRICILADQDLDGVHIAGLILNLIEQFWPELFEMDAVVRMETPVVVAKYGKTEEEFFSFESYKEWANNFNKRHTMDYYKGLGTHTSANFKKFIGNIERYLYVYNINHTGKELLDVVFNKNRATDRKTWLDDVSMNDFSA